jgi:hypothetical protein
VGTVNDNLRHSDCATVMLVALFHGKLGFELLAARLLSPYVVVVMILAIGHGVSHW